MTVLQDFEGFIERLLIIFNNVILMQFFIFSISLHLGRTVLVIKMLNGRESVQQKIKRQSNYAKGVTRVTYHGAGKPKKAVNPLTVAVWRIRIRGICIISLDPDPDLYKIMAGSGMRMKNDF